jgi:hypothetical protein
MPRIKNSKGELIDNPLAVVPSEVSSTSVNRFIPMKQVMLQSMNPIGFHKKYIESPVFEQNTKEQFKKAGKPDFMAKLMIQASRAKAKSSPKMTKREKPVEIKMGNKTVLEKGYYDPNTNQLVYDDESNLSHELGHYYDTVSRTMQPLEGGAQDEHGHYLSSPQEVRARIMEARNDVYRLFQQMPRGYNKRVLDKPVLRHYYDNIWRDDLKSKISYEQFEQLMNEMAANDTMQREQTRNFTINSLMKA